MNGNSNEPAARWYAGLLNKQVLILAVLLALIVFGCGVRYGGYIAGERQAAASAANKSAELAAQQPASAADYAVHIKGAVAAPGVYLLAAGALVEDAVQQARPLADADLQLLNLAAAVKNGQEIIVPYDHPTDDMEHDWNAAFYAANSAAQAAVSGGVVNINSADLLQLQTLPGIGAVKAQAIIDYREQHGGFDSIEELTHVSGIGAATFDKIKDQVVVE
ncbi:MAG: ComEA family DNA-binding protein [Bacillota bacterium]|nr:ComEA family DNA-binding protein [Bacillota bacterium]